MDDSILVSVKRALGIQPENTEFDHDIIMHINTVLSILYQLGLGDDAFVVDSSKQKWYDLLRGKTKLNFIKTYMFLKVKLMFDPPTTGSVMESYNRQIAELEFRINTEADPIFHRNKEE